MLKLRNKAHRLLGRRWRRHTSCFRRRWQMAFTLVEVLLAVTILSVGLTLVARSYITALKAMRTSQKLLVANLLLEEKIWARQEDNRLHSRAITEDEEGAFGAPFTEFSYRITVTEEENLPLQRKGALYRTSFCVSWRERKRNYSSSFLTYSRAK